MRQLGIALNSLRKTSSIFGGQSNLTFIAARNYAVKRVKKDISKVKIAIGQPHEHEELEAFILEYYVKVEPHFIGAGITTEIYAPEVDAVLRRGLSTPFTPVARDEKGEVVGLVINSVWKRQDYKPGYIFATLSRDLMLTRIFYDISEKFWEMADKRGIHTVLEGEIGALKPEYYRSGLIQKLDFWPFSPEKLKEYGIQGLWGQAGNKAAINGTRKSGYVTWHEFMLKDYKNEKGELPYLSSDGSDHWCLVWISTEEILRRRRLHNPEFY